MSNIPITSLPLAIALDGSEAVPIVQGGTTKRTTVGAIANTATGFVPTTRTINTPTAGGLTGGGSLAADLTLAWSPFDLTPKTAMVVADTFAINDSSLNSPAQVTFPNAMKALTGLSALAIPSLTNDYLIINHAADGLTYKISPSALSLAAGNVPAGGLTNQFLAKASNTNYDTIWADPAILLNALSLAGNPTGSQALSTSVTLGATLAFSGSALQTAALTSDVTAAANSFVTTVAAIRGNAVSGTTGTVNVVFSNSPSLVTPALGVATATSLAIGGATLGANALAVTGTAAVSSTVTGGTFVPTLNSIPTDGIYLNAAGQVAFAAGSTRIFFINSTGLLMANASGATLSSAAATATAPTLIPRRSDSGTGIGSSGTASLGLIASSIEQLRINNGSIIAYVASAIPVGGTAGLGYSFSSATNFGTFFGSGAPTLSAAQGSIYLRSDGSPYYNTDGSTGWGLLATTGGASIPTIAQGDLLYGSATNVLSALAKSTTATRYLANTGTTNNPAWAQIDLTNGVTGILPGANGGTSNGFFAVTGPTTSLKTFTFPNASATVLTDNALVTLAQGGTSANLTASNGGIFYSTASAGAILSGTATARQMLQSGATAAPAWSTATWPATTTINQLLYSSSANTVAGLATVNGGILNASATGVPSLTVTPVLGLAGTSTGTLGLSGVTSGVVTLQPASAAGTWSLTLPITGGTSGFFLQTNGSGVSTWAAPTWSNTRLAKTANYTVANADKGDTLALGGSAYFTLTFSAASGYDANFSVLVTNEDTARAKLLAINGLTSFYLYPGQSVWVYNDNNTWVSTGPYRWKLSGAVNCYVDGALGSDSTSVDGLAAGASAFATAAYAYSIFQKNVDLSGQVVTCNIVTGTTTISATQSIGGGPLVGATGPDSFVFLGAGRTSTIITSSTNGVQCFAGANFSQFSVRSMTLTSSGTAGIGINGQQGSAISWGDIKFNNCTGSGIDIAGGGTTAYAVSAYEYAGTFGFFAISEDHGQLYLGGANVTLTSTPVATSACYQADLGGFIDFTPKPTYTGSATGTKYNITQNAIINSNSVTFPGSVSGTQSSGGVLDSSLKQPTTTVLNSGTAATYTTPAGAVRLFVRMVGPGGSSSGSGTGAGNAASGSNTTFGTFTANAGSPGLTSGFGAAGGGASGGDVALTGGDGGMASAAAGAASFPGGNSVWAGAGAGQAQSAANSGRPGVANSGGGAGGSSGTAGTSAGGGGGGGGYLEGSITSLAATYTYTVGAGGTVGTAGTSGAAGGLGGSGKIIVTEYYN